MSCHGSVQFLTLSKAMDRPVCPCEVTRRRQSPNPAGPQRLCTAGLTASGCTVDSQSASYSALVRTACTRLDELLMLAKAAVEPAD